jgi:hypothetical protein
MSSRSATQSQSPRISFTAAYAAAIFFALHLFSYFVPSLSDATLTGAANAAIALAVLAVAQHLVVIPIVASLSAPQGHE